LIQLLTNLPPRSYTHFLYWLALQVPEIASSNGHRNGRRSRRDERGNTSFTGYHFFAAAHHDWRTSMPHLQVVTQAPGQASDHGKVLEGLQEVQRSELCFEAKVHYTRYTTQCYRHGRGKKTSTKASQEESSSSLLANRNKYLLH
jgi:hypothetical protein